MRCRKTLRKGHPKGEQNPIHLLAIRKEPKMRVKNGILYLNAAALELLREGKPIAHKQYWPVLLQRVNGDLRVSTFSLPENTNVSRLRNYQVSAREASISCSNLNLPEGTFMVRWDDVGEQLVVPLSQQSQPKYV